MPVPDFQTLMLPIMRTISDGRVWTNVDLHARLAEHFTLTPDDLREMMPSGQQTVFTNRVAWAKTHLKKAALLESPDRGLTRITPDGLRVLEASPAKINLRLLKTLDAYDWHKPAKDSPLISEADEDVGKSPEETLESANQMLREALAVEVLERVRQCSPQFFERLVVEVLVAMGYGGSLADAGQSIGRAGDGGIDGIIKEDKLGLDVVCIQAKRWENTVGRPVVQSFAGSMEGYRARKGVLITTARFSKDAYDYVKQIERKIVLIDGPTLAELMIDHDVGVTHARSFVVKKIDLDYFTDESA